MAQNPEQRPTSMEATQQRTTWIVAIVAIVAAIIAIYAVWQNMQLQERVAALSAEVQSAGAQAAAAGGLSDEIDALRAELEEVRAMAAQAGTPELPDEEEPALDEPDEEAPLDDENDENAQ